MTRNVLKPSKLTQKVVVETTILLAKDKNNPSESTPTTSQDKYYAQDELTFTQQSDKACLTLDKSGKRYAT